MATTTTTNRNEDKTMTTDAPDFSRLTKAQLTTMILRQKDMIDTLKQKLTRTEDTCREVYYELRDLKANA